MKIYFNRRPVQGPWGGGSKVLSSIVEESLNRNHQIYFEEEIFSQNDLDIIVCVDPRSNSKISFEDLLKYKREYGTKLVQRIGDLGTHGKPELFELLKKSTIFADALIFPSHWAKNFFNPPQGSKNFVIENAPLKKFLEQKDYEKSLSYDKKQINVVTHHWSDNFNKGFEIYKNFDEYCSTSNRFKFTYIGRKPSGIHFSNHLLPMDVDDLIEELPKHQVYLTASRQEAGANHVLEALALNIPVLYHSDGGSIVEYCKNYGYVYDSLEELIEILETSLHLLKETFLDMRYTRNSNDMAKEYVDLFEGIA